MKSLIDQFCCDIFGSIRRVGEDSPDLLTKPELTLLLASMPSGQFVIFESNSYTPHIATDEKHWYAENEHTCDELSLNAFRSLCKRGYIRHMELCVFKLSKRGLDAALHHAAAEEQGVCAPDAA